MTTLICDGMKTAIVFQAEVVKIQTLADGGLRLTFDLPETAIEPVALLMECKRQGAIGNVTFVPVAAEALYVLDFSGDAVDTA